MIQAISTSIYIFVSFILTHTEARSKEKTNMKLSKQNAVLDSQT